MKRNLFLTGIPGSLALLALPLVFALGLTGCPSEAEDADKVFGAFTFKYDGALELPVNSWTGGSNNQAQVSGTFTGIITSGKTYNVKITGALSHAAVLKVVFIDNADGNWHVLSSYGTVEDSKNDADGNPLPKLLPAGSLGENGIVIQVTTSLGASASGADANKVVLIGENTTDADSADKSTTGLKITGATIQIAEVGQPYPEITPWEAPEGAVKKEAAWANGTEVTAIDLEFPYTTDIPANAEYLYSIYLPKGAAFSEGALQLKGGVTDNPATDTWNWTEIGAIEAYGMAHIDSALFKTEGEYEVYHGKLTTVSGNSGDPSTVADHAAITSVHHITLQLTVSWVTYSGNIAFKFDGAQARQ
jgi:hypothetical protein